MVTTIQDAMMAASIFANASVGFRLHALAKTDAGQRLKHLRPVTRSCCLVHGSNDPIT